MGRTIPIYYGKIKNVPNHQPVLDHNFNSIGQYVENGTPSELSLKLVCH